jgi:lysine/ornithine N-monooxygenase
LTIGARYWITVAMDNKDLITVIDEFLAATGMGPTYFGAKAARNPHLVARLRAGGSVLVKTDRAVREFVKANSPSGGPALTAGD